MLLDACSTASEVCQVYNRALRKILILFIFDFHQLWQSILSSAENHSTITQLHTGFLLKQTDYHTKNYECTESNPPPERELEKLIELYIKIANLVAVC